MIFRIEFEYFYHFQKMSIKILVSGDVEGNISALFKRVETVHKKAGPFEMLLCVGSFFGPGNLGWSDYKSGRCKVPIPTYILGPTDPSQLLSYPDLGGCELCENVIYFGKQGCFTTKEGLKIVYISGRFKIEYESVNNTQQI